MSISDLWQITWMILLVITSYIWMPLLLLVLVLIGFGFLLVIVFIYDLITELQKKWQRRSFNKEQARKKFLNH